MTEPLPDPWRHSQALVDFWNRCAPEPFAMDRRAMLEYLRFPGAQVWTEGHSWRGLLWGRPNASPPSLDALLVLPEHRRQGHGRRLVQAFTRRLTSPAWRFGGGERHWVPGLPEACRQAHGFFLALGMVPDWEAHDLLWQASELHPRWPWPPSRFRLLHPQEAPRLVELLQHFGRRWQRDTERRLQAWNQGSEETVMGGFEQGRLVAFCHMWTPWSRELGPSTFWLERQRDLHWAGIGPLGVHPELRGRGLGVGVVQAALHCLRQRGIQRIGVDWTGLPEFYLRCGFSPWQRYRGYHAPP